MLLDWTSLSPSTTYWWCSGSRLMEVNGWGSLWSCQQGLLWQGRFEDCPGRSGTPSQLFPPEQTANLFCSEFLVCLILYILTSDQSSHLTVRTEDYGGLDRDLLLCIGVKCVWRRRMSGANMIWSDGAKRSERSHIYSICGISLPAWEWLTRRLVSVVQVGRFVSHPPALSRK